MILLLFDLLLILTLLGLALAALTSSDPRRAAMLFIAFGLWLSLVWARLRAPDVALAEAAIGAGVSGALLLSAARRAARGPRTADSEASAAEAPDETPDETQGGASNLAQRTAADRPT